MNGIVPFNDFVNCTREGGGPIYFFVSNHFYEGNFFFFFNTRAQSCFNNFVRTICNPVFRSIYTNETLHSRLEINTTIRLKTRTIMQNDCAITTTG